MSYTNLHLFNAAANSLISPVDASVAALIFMILTCFRIGHVLPKKQRVIGVFVGAKIILAKTHG
jgi:hypothetical protein